MKKINKFINSYKKFQSLTRHWKKKQHFCLKLSIINFY